MGTTHGQLQRMKFTPYQLGPHQDQNSPPRSSTPSPPSRSVPARLVSEVSSWKNPVRIDNADLLCLEKKAFDEKVAGLRTSQVHDANLFQLGSRWSPKSSVVDLSERDPIDEIPDDEEPEACEADVAGF